MNNFFKKFCFVLIFIFALTLLSPLANVQKTHATDDVDYYLVKYSEPKTAQEIADIYNISVDKVEELSEFGVFRIELKQIEINIGGYSPDSVFAQGLEYYEPDYRYSIPDEISTSYVDYADIESNDNNKNNKGDQQAYLTPDDPGYSSQWAFSNMDAADAWDSTTGSTSTIIAIVDTGINGTHEDLSGKVLAGYNYVNNTSISANSNSDDQGHGTAVGGTASAITNNSTGIAGLNWNARLMPVKVLDQYGLGYASDVAYGIRYAADNGADVINMSLGSRYASSIIESAVEYAHDTKGCVLVAATGNEYTTPISYPARYADTIAVGATNSSDVRSSYSNYGSDIDIVAPGTSIYTLDYSGGYQTVSGTSLATPYVSGLAALLSGYNSSLTNEQIRSAINDNADKVAGMGGENFTIYYGYGRINADSSIDNSGTYEYSYVSQNAYPTLAPGESYTFTLTIQNDGSETWTQSIVHLGTSHPQDRVPFYTLGSGWTGSNSNRVQMVESSVAPGAQANFSFGITIPASTSPGTYREYFQPVADGIGWMTDYGIYWDITVGTPEYTYVSQTPASSGDPDAAYVTVSPGQTFTLTLTLNNSGATTWSKTGSYPIRLGTSHPHDRVSDFGRGSGWLSGSTNRVELTDATVSAGSNTTITFQMIAPSTPGLYREYFQPVEEYITWMADYGIYWNIRVQ